MTTIDLPELPSIVARMVHRGVYAIYELRDDAASPYVLVTSSGVVHRVTAAGTISPPLSEGLAAFNVRSPVRIAARSDAGSVIHLNNQ